MTRIRSGLGLKALTLAILSASALSASAQNQDRAALLGTLPTEIQALYTDVVEVGPSAYGDFKAPAKPWRWCHSNPIWAIRGV